MGTLVAIPAGVWVQYFTEVHFIYYFPFCISITMIVGYLASRLFGGTKAPKELTLWGGSAKGAGDGSEKTQCRDDKTD